jgi:hypothetical protein
MAFAWDMNSSKDAVGLLAEKANAPVRLIHHQVCRCAGKLSWQPHETCRQAGSETCRQAVARLVGWLVCVQGGREGVAHVTRRKFVFRPSSKSSMRPGVQITISQPGRAERTLVWPLLLAPIQLPCPCYKV